MLSTGLYEILLVVNIASGNRAPVNKPLTRQLGPSTPVVETGLKIPSKQLLLHVLHSEKVVSSIKQHMMSLLHVKDSF